MSCLDAGKDPLIPTVRPAVDLPGHPNTIARDRSETHRAQNDRREHIASCDAPIPCPELSEVPQVDRGDWNNSTQLLGEPSCNRTGRRVLHMPWAILPRK